MEWQVMQVRPSSSKLRSTCESCVSPPAKTPIGLWQLSQCRENSIPFVRIRILTLVR